MEGSSAAGIITAIGVCITAVGGVFATLTLFIPMLRNTRALRTDVQEVHTIVNQQRTDMLERLRLLEETLRTAGQAVPANKPGEG